MAEIKNGQKWRHKKSGGLYEIVAADASVQVSPSDVGDFVANFLEAETWIAYRSTVGHRLYFRMAEEFVDGRFELVEDVE